MAYTYQDAQNLNSLFTAIGAVPIDVTATSTHFYWTSNQNTLARSTHSLGSITANVISADNLSEHRNITSSSTHVYTSGPFAGVFVFIEPFLIQSTGGLSSQRSSGWFESVQNYILAYNSDNSQIYTFPRQTQTSTSITYQRYSTSGTLLGTHTITTPVIAATYDNVRNRFYLQGNDRIAAFSVGSDHTLTADTSNDISSPSGFTIGRGIAYHNNTIYSIGSTSTFNTALGRFTVAAAPPANVAPTVTAQIPDQVISIPTSAHLNLSAYFSGTPAPTFSLGTGAPSFASVDSNTLDIEPQLSDVRESAYPITVIASNSEGTASDDFNITVSLPSLLVPIASITAVINIVPQTIDFTITWTNVTDYSGFDVLDITPTVSTGTRQTSVLSARSGSSYTYTVYPTSDTSGTAVISIAENVFTNPPSHGNNALTTGPTIRYGFAPVPTGSKYRCSIPLPTNESGTLHITMRERSVTGNSVLGPTTQSYLGSFEYNTTIRPELVRIDRPNLLEVGDNDVILDWNVEVEGVAVDQFYLEGITNIDTTNITLFSTATPDPDTSPDASARTTPIAVNTRAKYYLLRINIPEGTTITGNLDVYIVGGGINNDYQE